MKINVAVSLAPEVDKNVEFNLIVKGYIINAVKTKLKKICIILKKRYYVNWLILKKKQTHMSSEEGHERSISFCR